MTREQFISHVAATQEAFRRFLVALCCGDAELADDIAQDAYIKAFVASDLLKDPRKFNAWIFRIGYTTFINHKRSEKLTVDYDEAQHTLSDEATDSGFRYQDLYEALNRLPAKERMSVLLFYMEGYSIKEIAEIEGAKVDAVKQHLSRGRNHLRGLLSNT
ncbi:MAG: RNA polymerase sigma factor [Bacteroides sp.]|nr:RNA polymerase sigma factor [Bacteroides sp.]MCM1412963.1 RNA polymerase sigma factor [Bacteroides sp.]MCM1471669.1 RNA polymerase sigma factor [Bacteroides sp.]